MKRSEFVAKLNDTETPWVTSIAELAEAAGVKWDPEEEPLPNRLWVVEGSIRIDNPGSGGPGTSICMAPTNPCRHGREYEHRVLAEAVRRYNAWAELASLVAKGLGTYGRSGEDYHLLKKLVAILNGKEG